MKNGSRLYITAEILNAASAGALKTNMMYSASLSFVQLKDYLSVLIDCGLLEYDAKKKIYKTTDKGHDFLTKCRKAKIQPAEIGPKRHFPIPHVVITVAKFGYLHVNLT